MRFEDELCLLKEQLLFKEQIRSPKEFDNVVIAGMGGSGIAGKIFQELYDGKPVCIVDDYSAPKFISIKTLFIAISFSGNTEETISALNQAKAKGAYVITISSGGKLEGLGDEHVKIPRSDIQPRSATGYMLMPLLRSVMDIDSAIISSTYKTLASLDEDNGECKGHAERIFSGDKIPVIYGVSPFKSVAYRWKTQFNENSKVIAYSGSFPELNHNDTMALADTYRKDQFYFLAFESENKRIMERISITGEITGNQFNVVKPKGSSTIEKLFYLIHYGDYVSYHLGRLRQKEPADVRLIEELKKRLGPLDG
jgi:glucose/mannose-6-phosphate isomerase